MKYKRLGGARISRPASLFLLVLVALPAALLFASGEFEDSGQALGGDTSYDIALADLDGDKDLDAFVANGLGNRVWLNQGGIQGGTAALFQNSGQSPGLLVSRGAALADLDGNQTLDAFVANDGENETWLNNGAGQFSLKQQIVSNTTDSQDVALGLLNKDNFPNVFVANNGANEVWFNNGDGTFSVAQSGLGSAWSREIVLGDVNNDGFVDAYVANGTTFALADELWLNNGQGQLNASGQNLDLGWNEGAALGDLDGDDDLDIFLATWFGADGVWINQGGAQGGKPGQFKDSSQALSGNASTDVALIDVDNDDDLDAIVAKFTGQASEVWINNGKGQFSNSGQQLDDAAAYQVAVGDLDLDGDADLFFANFGPNHIWLMGGIGLPKAWFNVAARQNSNGVTVYPWARPDDAQLPVVLDFAASKSLTVVAEIDSHAGVKTQPLPFPAGQTAAQLTIPNPDPAFTDTMKITLTVDDSATLESHLLASLQKATNTTVKINPLQLIFINEQSGPSNCILCMIDWVLKIAGFEPSFWQLHHIELADLRASVSWSYYMGLFQAHDSELTTILLTHPALLWETFDMLQVWTPGILAADDDQDDTAIITAPQAKGTKELFEKIAAAAGPRLAETIDSELDALNFPSFAGRNIDQLLDRLQQRIKGQIYLPVTARHNE